LAEIVTARWLQGVISAASKGAQLGSTNANTRNETVEVQRSLV
jgi:hypothetical protein